MDKKNFADTVLKSLDNAKKAEPSVAFLLKMEAMAKAYVGVQEKIAFKHILGIAASLIILITMNVYTLDKQDNISKDEVFVQAENNYNMIPTKSIYHE